jgi:type I restriction enzyme S subunit
VSRWPLPESWCWVQVQEIADVIGGGTPNASDPANFSEVGSPWLTPADLSGYEGAYISRGARSLSEQGLATSSARLLPAGSVLFSSRAPIGYTVIAANPIATNQGFKSLVLADDIDPRFVRYYLLASRDYAESLASGSTFKELSGGRIKELLVPLPPAAEQRRIATKLDELLQGSRASRAALAMVPALLEQYRQSVLAAAFRGELSLDWRFANPGAEGGDALVEAIDKELAAGRGRHSQQKRSARDESLPTIPASWRWVDAGRCTSRLTVGHVGPMQTRYVADGVRFLRSQNVRENRIDTAGLQFIPDDFHAELAKSALFPGDVVIVRSGAPGVAAVIPDDFPEANCADLVIARFSALIEPELMARFINSQQCRERVFDRQVGVAQQHFNVGAMRTLPVPIMPLAEQHELLRLIRMHEAAIEVVRERTRMAYQDLSTFDTATLSKALSGELVAQDPTDEPASVMLRRIQTQRVTGL